MWGVWMYTHLRCSIWCMCVVVVGPLQGQIPVEEKLQMHFFSSPSFPALEQHQWNLAVFADWL